MNKQLEKISNRLVEAFLKNKIIPSLPLRYTQKIENAQKYRLLCESKIKDPIIGFKAAETGISVMKKLKEKEPFYASIFKKNFLRSGQKVKINNFTLGIKLEVCYLIKKNFFLSKGIVIRNNVSKYISHIAPCIEVVGYRQRKKGITSFGDFGANVKFFIGRKKKYRKIKIENLKTIISNKKIKQSIIGNTNTVYINPLNSLRFVLNKIEKDKVNLNKDFYVFTGSTVGVVPILSKGLYTDKIDKLGSVKTIIH